MPVYKKNGKYFARINYTTADGRHVPKQSKYFKLKRDAELEEIKLVQKYKPNKLELSNKHYTLKQVCDELYISKVNKNFSEGTLRRNRAYINSLKKYFDYRIDRITQVEINEILKDMESKYAQATYISYTNFIEQIFKYAKNKLHQELNEFEIVCPKITVPTRRLNFYDENEFESFISCVDDEMYKTLFTLLFYNGLRISEARGIKFSDVKNDTIIIDKQFYRTKLTPILKTKHSYRILPINNILINQITNLKKDCSSYYGFDDDWFIFGGLKPVGDKAITNHYEIARTKAKLKRITIHEFRHSCASHYIHLGYPIHLIAELLGDNIDTVVKTYYHLYNNDLKNMINNIK